MHLLAECVWLGGSVHDRYACLEADVRDLVVEAAAAAIAIRRHDTALEWIEQGHCIVWTQLLELRTPLDKLCDIHPELADKLDNISQLLERSPMSWSNEARMNYSHQTCIRTYLVHFTSTTRPCDWAWFVGGFTSLHFT